MKRNEAIIPIIDISDGWSIDDIETEEDCDEAYAYLMAAVAEIEYQLDMEQTKPIAEQRWPWKNGAKRALKYKRAALQLVGFKRGQINEARKWELQNSKDRKLLEFIRSVTDDKEFLEWVRAAGV